MNTIQFSRRNLIFLLTLLAVLGIVYFTLFALVYGYRKIVNRKENKNNEEMRGWIDDFKRMGEKLEKVAIHRYENMYGTYLGPLRDKELNLLEIGLGCPDIDESYVKPGSSLFLWQEYLPHAKISVMEINKECAEAFKDKVENLYIGDQADMAFLSNTVDSTNEYFDVIIDDGGHSRRQQISSLIGLWPLVKPNGGIYIIEDTFHSFLNSSNDHTESVFDIVSKIVYLFNEDAERTAGGQQQFLNPFEFGEEVGANLRQFAKDLSNINCYYHACVFVKKFIV
jgi:hypothetical protein